MEFFSNLADISLLQCLIFGEAEGEPLDSKVGVALVVRNRVFNPGWWGDSWHTVMLKKWQFSCFTELRDKIISRYKVRETDRIMRECKWIAEGVIAGDVQDLTRGANHYHAEYLIPYWAKGETPTAIIGKHIFYQL